MGTQAPHCILIFAHLAEVAAFGMEIVEFAQFAAIHQLLETADRRMIKQKMAYHQHQATGSGQSDQGRSLIHL
jgi:uncharacterized protein YerC